MWPFSSDKDKKIEPPLTGGGYGKKSENRRLMEEIMDPNKHDGPCRGPNCGHNDPPKKKKSS